MVEELLHSTTPAGVAAESITLRRPWWSRLSRRQLAALLAALLAGALNLVALQQGEQRTAIVVAAQTLVAGTRLQEHVVRTVAVAADTQTLGTLINAERLSERVGWIVERRISPGEPLRWSDLRAPSDTRGPRAMSVPVEPEHAVGGALQPGDRVDVAAVREGRAHWILAAAEVLDVAPLSDGGGLGALRAYTVTLAVSEDEALRLAWALHDGAIEIVRATGAAPLQHTSMVIGAAA